MIGSPNPIFAIASNENSGIGPQLLEEYLLSKEKEVSHGYDRLILPGSPAAPFAIADMPL